MNHHNNIWNSILIVENWRFISGIVQILLFHAMHRILIYFSNSMKIFVFSILTVPFYLINVLSFFCLFQFLRILIWRPTQIVKWNNQNKLCVPCYICKTCMGNMLCHKYAYILDVLHLSFVDLTIFPLIHKIKSKLERYCCPIHKMNETAFELNWITYCKFTKYVIHFLYYAHFNLLVMLMTFFFFFFFGGEGGDFTTCIEYCRRLWWILWIVSIIASAPNPMKCLL